MSGLRILEMGVGDMLDVIHFMFEEDSHYVSEESVKSRSEFRTAIYDSLYGVEYKYKYNAGKQSGNQAHMYEDASDMDYMSDAESQQAFSPSEIKEPMKPPAQTPTKFDFDADNPFSGVLDAPMN